MDQVNATRTFLGDEAQWPTIKVELSDIQGLWGGRRIQVLGAEKVVVQSVQRGHFERRYEFKLDSDRWKRLIALFVEQDFLTIKPAERMGIPDEARPTITLINATGEKSTVSKWSGVKDERFDSLYSALTELETMTEGLEPVYSGPYQYES